MAGKFVLKPSGDQFMFNLYAGNGQVVLTSERYTSKAGATAGIASVKQNAASPAHFELRQNKNGEPYFILKASNGQEIGRSETYSSEKAATDGMDAVKRAAAEALVDDQTA